LFSAALLFAPSLSALGTVGPIVVRLATDDLRATGHRVGSVYAISTAGSLLGTLLAGFVLVPALETNHILAGTAAMLVLVGAIPLVLRKAPATLAAVLIPLLELAVPERTLPEGIKVLDRSQSLLGLVEVIDDSKRGVRFLRADHSIIGAHYTRDRSAAFAFLHVLEVVRFIRPGARDLLQIGLGIGSVPMALERHGFKADVVEIDPHVVRFARQHFGFAIKGETFTEDARTLLRRTQRRYDVIVHDTFTGGSTPEHLLSMEVVERAHAILRPGGLLALNFSGAENDQATLWVARTIRAVFRNVRIFRDSQPADASSTTNLVFFASDDPMSFGVPDRATFENDACEGIGRSFPDWEVLRTVPEGPAITDSWNPLARLQLPVAEKHFEAMKELLPKEVWLP
jgi:hypothetical protein